MFLVLCGPSKMRKTEFAKSLFNNPSIHKDKVDWDGYSWLENGCIIFDDINQPDHIWKYLRTNKVLFQSSPIVAVNTSATNCYKRDVCVVQKPIIICTNDGLLDNFVSAPYREWIEANSVWVDVNEQIPFWLAGGCELASWVGLLLAGCWLDAAMLLACWLSTACIVSEPASSAPRTTPTRRSALAPVAAAAV